MYFPKSLGPPDRSVLPGSARSGIQLSHVPLQLACANPHVDALEVEATAVLAVDLEVILEQCLRAQGLEPSGLKANMDGKYFDPLTLV